MKKIKNSLLQCFIKHNIEFLIYDIEEKFSKNVSYRQYERYEKILSLHRLNFELMRVIYLASNVGRIMSVETLSDWSQGSIMLRSMKSTVLILYCQHHLLNKLFSFILNPIDLKIIFFILSKRNFTKWLFSNFQKFFPYQNIFSVFFRAQ